MATKHMPGPICQATSPRNVDDGTTCKAVSSEPGATGNATTLGLALNGNPDHSTWDGSAVPVGVGVASVVRIPVPGTNGLHVELRPRFSGGWRPKGGSTSTLFIQDVTGKRVLRLDHGPNPVSKGIDYHWNQKGTFNEFGITDHLKVGSAGKALYEGAKYFKYGGRVLLVVGVAIDMYSIVVAKKRIRQIARVAAGWAGAWAGCEYAGAWGAGIGTGAEPGGGTAVGGLLGCAIGGIAGYAGASWAASHAYDWVEETFFEQVPTTTAP